MIISWIISASALVFSGFGTAHAWLRRASCIVEACASEQVGLVGIHSYPQSPLVDRLGQANRRPLRRIQAEVKT